MTTTLTLSNGTTTLNLNQVDGAYELIDQSWAPAVRQREQRTLGGRLPYAEQEENLALLIRTTTSPTVSALTHLLNLHALIDGAMLWADEGVGAPVVLTYQPNGATRSYQALVFGPAGDMDGTTRLHDPGNSVLYPVPVKIRIGIWLAAAESLSTSNASAGTIQSVTFATAALIPSPISVAVGEFLHAWFGNGLSSPPFYLAVSNATTNLAVLEGESGSGSSAAIVDRSAKSARGGNVLSCTASGGLAFVTWSLSGVISANRIGVIAVVGRSTSSLTGPRTYTLQAGLVDGLGFQTQADPVAYTQTDFPRAVYLGAINKPHATSLRIDYTRPDSNPLEIDYLVLVGLDNGMDSHIIEFNGELKPTQMYTATESYINVRHTPLTRRRAFAGVIGLGSGGDPVPEPTLAREVASRGDLAIAMTGTTVASIWVGTNGGVSDRYRTTQLINASPLVTSLHQATTTITRQRAFLTPE